MDLFGGEQTSSGERVNGDTAILNPNVYACASILGGDIGKLPINVFRRSRGGGLERDTSHPVSQLLGIRPNPYMSAYSFKELMQVHLVTWGNAYAYIEWNWDGRPKALWPLNPALTDVRIDLETGQIWYYTTLMTGEMLVMPWHDVFHLKMISRNGLKGLTPIEVLREEIGTQQSIKKFVGAFYANGTATRGVLKVPTALNKDAKEKARNEWQKLNSGLTNAHKIAILDAGLDYQNIGMPLADAQFIETTKMGILEIAKVYKIPAHKLNQLDRATFSNIEQQSLDYVKNTLQPIVAQWEQEILYKLFTESEQKRFYARFDLTSELRGDAASRSAYYKAMWEIGAFSINQILALEDQEGIGPDGDKHFVPLNYIPVDAAAKITSPKGGEGGGQGDPHPDDAGGVASGE
ncbi:portal protein [Alicyclobacillus contaminans]|nr:portal protein [Alicyclobacillus contaminans]GMA52609.1 portal protein [Alicyclobacillus contaminans]